MANKKAVLIIDDEPSVADALKVILNDYGYDAVVAQTGLDGLEQAGCRQFDLTITDLQLPDISGLEVLASIREINPNQRVIIITAHISPEIITKAADGGAITVLSKPFLPSDILKLTKEVLTNRDPRD
jgi:two-component system chemotaxis response regulator CheY